MKRLGMLLVLVSVSMFALGCAEGKKDAKDAKGGTTVEKKATDAPAAPPAEKKADEKK